MMGALVGYDGKSKHSQVMSMLTDGVYKCKDRGVEDVIIVVNPDGYDYYMSTYHQEVISSLSEVVNIGGVMVSRNVPKNTVMIADKDSVKNDKSVRPPAGSGPQ